MQTTRKYRGKSVEMLTTCNVIIENAIADQEFLVTKRASWTKPFFKNIETRIERAFTNTLGIDNVANQRAATQTLLSIQEEALAELAELKIQIQEDFKADKKRRDEILKLLGYTDYHKLSQNKDQEALVQQLYQFNTNLSPGLIAEVSAKGTDEKIFLRIASFAELLSKANVTQETIKGTQKNLTEEAITEFNGIYDDVIKIAKIAHNFHKGKPNMQALFSYTKIRKKLNATPTSKNDETQE